jgi:hypothetical protein
VKQESAAPIMDFGVNVVMKFRSGGAPSSPRPCKTFNFGNFDRIVGFLLANQIAKLVAWGS